MDTCAHVYEMPVLGHRIGLPSMLASTSSSSGAWGGAPAGRVVDVWVIDHPAVRRVVEAVSGAASAASWVVAHVH